MKLRSNYRLIEVQNSDDQGPTWGMEWYLEWYSPGHNFYAVNIKHNYHAVNVKLKK